MSTCISMAGEFGSHTLDSEHTCTLCGVLDEDALRADLRALREIVATHDTAVVEMAATLASPHGSPYGEEFDRIAGHWAVIENAHDEIHPDRDACGGVGGCSMMFAADMFEAKLGELLDQWRKAAK